jgi:predicted glycoside hydrolase/deacetylase ChbG (UPF0249 family)
MSSSKCLFAFAFLIALPVWAQTRTVAERLGYPAGSKLLIIHADDLAVAHSEDVASFETLDNGSVTSASIMVPCPWLTEVANYAKAHPDADLGLHLTLTSEWKTYRWGPVSPADKVPSLIDSAGTLWPDTPTAAAREKPEDAEREIRAQVERALAVGIHPTHLDSHMGALFSRPDLFAVYVKVAHEYHLPFLAALVTDERSKMLSLLAPNDIALDAVVIAGPEVRAGQWKDFYLNAVKNLKPGISEIIVHLGHDDAELQAVMVDNDAYGAAWRQRDFDVMNSAEFKKALTDNHVILVKWKDLGKLVNQ